MYIMSIFHSSYIHNIVFFITDFLVEDWAYSYTMYNKCNILVQYSTYLFSDVLYLYFVITLYEITVILNILLYLYE